MIKTIFVGNLPWSTSEAELSDLFGQYGDVQAARLITDRETGRSRGFGFVEMEEANADEAIQALDGTDLGGRPLRVNEAQEKRERRPRW